MIAISSRVAGGEATLTVRDTGPGVTPADRERIFDRSGRGRGARREGAGLGLAIVRAIAEAHGGRVAVDRPDGGGAAFRLTLPVDPPATTRERPTSSIPIVEDEDRIASFVDKALRANGFATTAVGEGERALAVASGGRFDLVILDPGLPDLDGLEVLRRLRDRGVRVPVVILTARDGVEATVAGLESGADDYIAKPFRLEELLARVRVRLRGDPAVEPTVLHVGDTSLDLRTRRAKVAGRTVELSAREFALAEMLFRHPGQVLTREQLLDHVRATTTTRAPTSWTSTSATCARSWASGSSRASAAWATGWSRTEAPPRAEPAARPGRAAGTAAMTGSIAPSG